MSAPEQRRPALPPLLTRLLRPFRREPSEQELAAQSVREYPEAFVKVILKQVLDNDETISAEQARIQARIRIDALHDTLDGETRSELASIADRQIDENPAEFPPVDIADANEESREPATP